jgi:hypothetical protein
MRLTNLFEGVRLPLWPSPDPAEQERLLKLFWNRAELKKELTSLDGELHELGDRLQEQEAANARLREQLEHLEELLGTPERGFDALVHFGLRGLWRACRTQLVHFQQELRRQQEERERRRQQSDFLADRGERLKIADRRLLESVQQAEAAASAVAAAEGRLSALGGFWNYFRRRRAAVELEALRARRTQEERSLADMREAHRTIEKEPLPEFPGLSIEGRRLINVAVIAYGVILLQRLHSLGLATQARAAMNRSVHDARYGSRESCMDRMASIQRGVVLARRQEGVAAEIRTETERLRPLLVWKYEADTLPTPESLPPARSGHADPGGHLLIDDYWDVNRILLR